MNFSDITQNQFVQESTLHGVSHLRYSRSKARNAFWLIVTFLSMGYAGIEISREIKRISSGIEFETTYRLARADEIQFPQMAYCFSNPFDIFDWKIVLAYMTTFNWTIEDVGLLLAIYPGFWHLDLKSKNVSMQHVQQLGNIANEI
uniref:Uncharacterized protein n=1 Tax=Romanomermis culicivorax TaxID=13658 RepID=A0A915KS12_ROMCU